MHNTYDTREAWLTEATVLLRTELLTEQMFDDKPSWPPYRVACGFPGGGSARTRIGEAWHKDSSTDGHAQVFVSPTLEDPVQVLATLAHELLHVWLETLVPGTGHGKRFSQACKRIDLAGKPTATYAGEVLAEWFRASVIPRLGPYPHGKLSLDGRKKQSTRLLKVECPECGYLARVTRKWLDEIGPPYCACTGGETRMEIA